MNFSKEPLTRLNPSGYYWYCDKWKNVRFGYWCASSLKFMLHNNQELSVSSIGYIWFGEKIELPAANLID